MPLKLIDSESAPHTTHTSNIKKQQVSNGSLKNLRSTALVDLLGRMIV